MFQIEVAEKIKTLIFCSKRFFEYNVAYEAMWQNMVKPYKSQMTR